MKEYDVLLTNGNQYNTYGALRTLSANGLKVAVINSSRFDCCNFSRLNKKSFFISKPNLTDLLKILRSYKIKVFIPIGLEWFEIAVKNAEYLKSYTSFLFPDYDVWDLATNKARTFDWLKRLNISIPKTVCLKDMGDIDHYRDIISYPCVLKMLYSRDKCNVLYCHNEDELKSNYLSMVNEHKSIIESSSSYPLLQEYIEGKGYGYFGIYNKGKCIQYFMHKRIHEYPITGGSSTLAKSLYDENLRIIGDKILTQLKWNGVAMVEFKKNDKDGLFYVIEINAKYWGSLELSLSAGINFPFLNYQLALGKEPTSVSENYSDIYFRWKYPFDKLWEKSVSVKERLDFKKFMAANKKLIKEDTYHDDPGVFLQKLLYSVYKTFEIKSHLQK